MSAPYRIVDKYYETVREFGKHVSLDVVIATCKHSYPDSHTVHGDNVDEGCTDGLSRDEREQVEEGLR
jgi:hypothetical protein